MLPPWVDSYIGCPFKDLGRTPEGWDCYGLVHYVYKNHFDITLPVANSEYTDAQDTKSAYRQVQQEIDKWTLVDKKDTAFGDVVLLNVKGFPVHCGMALDQQRILHITKGISTSVENFRSSSSRWANRYAGTYRYNKA